MKKSYTAGFKSRVAIEAIKGEKTLAELASIYQVHVSQIRQWKSKAMEALPRVFESKKEKRQKEQEIGIDDVYKRVGQLEVENDFLKKSTASSG